MTDSTQYMDSQAGLCRSYVINLGQQCPMISALGTPQKVMIKTDAGKGETLPTS